MTLQFNPLELGGFKKPRDLEDKASGLEFLGIDSEELEQIIRILKGREAARKQPLDFRQVWQPENESRCPRCQMSYKDLTGYCCPRPDCLQSGPTC